MPLSVWIRLRGDLATMVQGLGGTSGFEVTRFKAFNSRIAIATPPRHLVDLQPAARASQADGA